ncbi:MAG: helix-turn-helix domain-containing protein [Allosphingosinicella sp.]
MDAVDRLTLLPARPTSPGTGRIILSDLGRCEYLVPSSPGAVNLVLEGEEVYEVDGARLRVRAGEMILMEAGQPMRVVLEKPAGNRAICICLPGPTGPQATAVVSAPTSDLGRYLLSTSDGGDPTALLGHVVRHLPAFGEKVRSRLDAVPSVRFQTRRRLLQRLERAAARLHGEGDASLSDLAALAGIAVHHFARTFAAVYGLPPAAYRRRIRIDKVALALEAGMRPAEAAERFGFADQASLTRAFRREKGASPAAWARSRRLK